MLGVGLAIGALMFSAGLVLIGLSGSRRRSGTWIGPTGALLTTIGLVVEIASAMQG